jgi:hypothetical protein
MRKSLVLALMAVSGGASYGATVGSAGDNFQRADPSIWRWSVSSILDAQKQDPPSVRTFQAVGALDPGAFQRHERYSPLGLPDAERSP